MSKRKYWVTVCISLLLLQGCSKGINRQLDTEHGMEPYKASLQQAFKDMPEKEQRAFDWAVSDFNLERLHALYPNKTPQTIIRAERDKIIADVPPRLAQLAPAKTAYEAAYADLLKVQAADARFVMEKDFFGLQPTVVATIHNGSKHDLSSADFIARLYVDDRPEPVAQSTLFSNYNNDSGNSTGLRQGESVAMRFRVGFVSGDASWKTVEIQQARKTRVELTVLPDSAKDTGNRALLDDSAAKQFKALEDALATAKSYADI